MGMKKALCRSASGQFVRNLGWKPNADSGSNLSFSDTRSDTGKGLSDTVHLGHLVAEGGGDTVEASNVNRTLVRMTGLPCRTSWEFVFREPHFDVLAGKINSLLRENFTEVRTLPPDLRECSL
jgi:hypothetical protein